MRKRAMIAAMILLAMGMLAGCTPFSENISRRDQGYSTGNEPTNFTLEELDGLTVDSVLDRGTSSIITHYGPTIRKYSERYGFDWRLILAVMKQESRFSTEAESHRGATGLMQIMPVTSLQVAKSLSIDDMSHPQNNIRGGIYYLRRLYLAFEGANEADRLKLTLAAYNAGLGRVNDAQELAVYLKDNPRTWQAVRDALPLLSKRFYTLHKTVWGQSKPKTGWFGNARETVNYVDSVMDYYDEYRVLLN